VPTYRILSDFRLVCPDGTKLDMDVRWLSNAEAASAAGTADAVVLSTAVGTSEIAGERQAIHDLIARVDEGVGEVGARLYRGSGRVALVLKEFH
jgi:demethoxyubiquinone hydroxylase (CLK1/Coq7/Cat5 family)